MWKLRPLIEVIQERKEREQKSKYIALLLIILSLWFLNGEYSSINELVKAYKTNPEHLLSVLFMPVLIYAGYRSYVLHGSFLSWTSERVCIGCNKTWYHSNNGWGFMSFGKKTPKWYQMKVCKTPEKCNIVGMHEVIWVPEEQTHNKAFQPTEKSGG